MTKNEINKINYMTKEEARAILEKYFNNQAERQLEMGLLVEIRMPYTDEIIHHISHISNMDFVFEQWSFKGLIKIAYDLCAVGQTGT